LRRLSLAFALAALGFSSSAFSQGRTIEETLVVSDPTVAAAGKWAVGGAVEYWKTHSEFDVFFNEAKGTGTLDFAQTGYNVFAGYGNWTLQATGRKGDGDYNATGSPKCCGPITVDGTQKATDSEITLRYLWPTRSISPYVLVGYTDTKLQLTETIVASPAVPGTQFTCTSSKTRTSDTTYKGPLLGGGAVIPFSQRFGMRTALRLKWYKGTYDENGTGAACQHTDGSGLGYDFTLTGYWNIIAGLNAQIGVKAQWLNAGEDVPDWYKLGVFGMLGYTFRF